MQPKAASHQHQGPSAQRAVRLRHVGPPRRREGARNGREDYQDVHERLRQSRALDVGRGLQLHQQYGDNNF